MVGKPGPFQIVESDGCGFVDSPMSPPRRRYGCPHYASCLDLAAALNWDNFTCRGCSGAIDQSLYWRAHQAKKHDAVIETICEIPEIRFMAGDTPKPQEPIRLVVKR